MTARQHGRRRASRRPSERGQRPEPIPALRRLDSSRIPKGGNELRAFMTARNESTRLPFVIQHHRTLGIDRFFVVDNASDDGTTELLMAEPDVHVFSAAGSFSAAAFGMDWLHRLLAEHGVGRWVVVIDADEYLVFPGCESLELREYCRAVERAGFDAISAMVVDMYPEGPIARASPARATSLLNVAPFFDQKGYVLTGARADMPSVHGGPRARRFWPEVDFNGPARYLSNLLERAWDEDSYRALHADVRQAAADGVVQSGLEHFLRYGHSEGRQITIRPVPDWPEDVYLDANPEIRDAIATGVVQSGLDHFFRFGQFEGRFPGIDLSPCLSVCPIVRWTGGKRFLTCRHGVQGAHFNTAYEFGSALLHFKMLDDFPVRAAAEAGRLEHWKDAAEYTRYASVFAAEPKLSVYFDESTRYSGSHHLVSLGYMREAFIPPARFRAGGRDARLLRRLGEPA